MSKSSYFQDFLLKDQFPVPVREAAYDQATMVVMLLSRQTFVDSKMGSRCSDWKTG